MNISKGLRNSVTELLSICDEQISRWKLTREQLAMLTSNGNGHVPQVFAMAEAAIATHKEHKVKAPKGRKSYGGKHWTQTPSGKRRMAEIQKMAWKKARAKRKQASDFVVPAPK